MAQTFESSAPKAAGGTVHRGRSPASTRAAATVFALLAALPVSVWAQETPAPEAPKEKSGLWERDTLSGDWGGVRTWLDRHGITLDLTETDEVLGDIRGGLRQGAVVDGKTEVDLGLDLEKLVGWDGARFKVSAYQIHGRGLSANYVGNLLTVSNIEAESSTRLADLYLEQSLFGDRLNIRIGQFAADEEFLTSDVAGVFINSTFGWPGINALDLPGGGPAYPFSTPGLRVRFSPTPSAGIQAAVFNGNPLGTRGDPGGTEFPLDGAFAIIEAAYSTVPGKGQQGLGGHYKIGAWYNSLRFDDLHVDTQGVSLASPASNGIPTQHSGNYGLYASVDHALWRTPGTEDGGLSGFARIATVPQQDRSPVYVYVDGGLTWKGPFPGRDDDVAGVAFAWANLSHSLRSLDRDTIFFTCMSQPIRSAEMVLEVTYQAQIAPWLLLQPDFQYVFHPGGNAPSPDSPSQPIKDAAVVGIRSVIKF